jgi:TolB-like protein/Tfp pilus assembly protein PilF
VGTSSSGYRFVAEVKPSNGASFPSTHSFDHPLARADGDLSCSDIGEADSPRVEKVASDRKPNAGRLSLLALALVVIASFFATGYLLMGRYRSNNEYPAVKSLAVLPVRPINDENHDPIYELGIAESLILKLSSSKSLVVRPLSSTRIYRQIDQSPAAAGEEQKVDYVLSSNYQVADGKIRVTSQLIDVRTGAVSAVFKSERNPENVFLMQDQIADDIGNKLLTQFGSQQNVLNKKRGTENEAAYRLFLQAEYVFDQVKKEEAGRAVDYLEKATELDPNYAEAYAILGMAYHIAPKISFSADERYRRSKAAVERALQLNPSLAEAHAVLGMIKDNAEFDQSGADLEFRRALELDPDSPSVRAIYSTHCVSVGRFDEAISQINLAMELEPASMSLQITYGTTLYYAHRYSEATAHFKRLLGKDQNAAYVYFWLWLLYDLQGNETEAYAWFIKYQTQIRAAPETLQTYQAAYERSGWKGILRKTIEIDKKNLNTENAGRLYYEMACFSARLGNKEEAFEYLNQMYKQPGFVTTLTKVDPYLDSLHGDPRFGAIVRKIGVG